MNRWNEKWFSNLHAHSKLLFIHISENIGEDGFYDLSMKRLRIALKPLNDIEIRLAFGQIKDLLNITSDNKKASVKGCNCAIDPLFKNDGDLFLRFIKEFNEKRKTKYKSISKVKAQFTARIKEGYTIQEIIKALENAMQDKFHSENDFKDLTPEFITRADKLEKYMNYQQKEKSKKGQTINF